MVTNSKMMAKYLTNKMNSNNICSLRKANIQIPVFVSSLINIKLVCRIIFITHFNLYAKPESYNTIFIDLTPHI